MQLKRWESPRREGRNDKGKGGSARKRQLKKQRQMLRQKLKEAQKSHEKQLDNQQKGKRGEEFHLPLFFCVGTNQENLKLSIVQVILM
jgi:hypothetical protein